MTNSSRAQRNTCSRQPYAWLGAGALGVGLALAGAGTAHADEASAAAETPSTRISASAAAAPGASAATSRSTAAVRTAAPGRSPAATSRSVRVSQPVPAAAASERLTPARVAAVSGTRVAAVADRPASAVSVSAEVSPVDTPAPAAAAASAGVVTPAPSQATIAVTNWFSSTRGWLNGFDGPLAAAAQDVLVGVQRTLFSPGPTVKPVQYSTWTPGEPILGALKYVQPGGAAVSMQLTQAPTFGTVQLLSSGAYTYTPGPDFTGTDSFTAEVTAGGFNLLEPFTPRTSSVAVNINPGPPVMLTRGFDITNLTGKAVYVQKIIKESGYENSLEAGPSVGQILQPGQSTHVELTRYAFYSYYTYINFASCSDIACTSYKEGAAGPWQAKMYVQLLDTYRGDCNWNNCWNGSGQEIGPPSPNGFYGLDNSVIKLVDEPGTSYTLTGAEGQQQANVLNTVCTAQGTTCQFVPTADTQSTTKPEQVYQFSNQTQDNQTVNQGATATVSATSSFGTTFSTEVGASFGQKDVFNFVAKQTFTSTQSLSNTTQRTTNWAVNTTVRPGYRLTTTLDVPVARVTGNYRALIGNTTYNLTGVYFDFIDPNAPAQFVYASTTTPIPA